MEFDLERCQFNDLTLEEEMLNFVYWLNPKKVKDYGRN